MRGRLTHSICSVAIVVSLVFTVWSFLRWPEVFSELSQDAVTKYSASQQWSLLGRRYGWSRTTQSGSPNFPNVYRGNCRDPILVVVGKFNDNIMSFVAIIDGWWAD